MTLRVRLTLANVATLAVATLLVGVGVYTLAAHAARHDAVFALRVAMRRETRDIDRTGHLMRLPGTEAALVEPQGKVLLGTWPKGLSSRVRLTPSGKIRSLYLLRESQVTG
jgi:hypothetical protein